MNTCASGIQAPISQADFDIYDIRAPRNDPFPPSTYISYLQDCSIQDRIGAQQLYQECPTAPFEMIISSGDCKHHT